MGDAGVRRAERVDRPRPVGQEPLLPGCGSLVPLAYAGSEATWAAVRFLSGTYDVPQVAREALRLHSILTVPITGTLGLLALYAVVRASRGGARGETSTGWLAACFVALNVAATAWGLSLGNNALLVLGDAYRLLLTPVMFVAVVATVPSRGALRLLRSIFVVDLLAALTRMPTYVQAVLTERLDQRHDPPSLFMFVFPLVCAIVADTRRRRLAWALAAAFAASCFALSLSRTHAGIVLASSLMVGLLLGVRRSLAASVRIAGALAVLAAVAASLNPSFPRTQAEAWRGRALAVLPLDSTTSIDPVARYDVSVRQRAAELGWLLREWRDRPSEWVWLLGFGNGAVYDLDPFASSYWYYADSGFRMHYWHNIGFALIHRMGLIGTLAFLVCLGSFSVQALRLLQSRRVERGSVVVPTAVLAYLAATALLAMTFAGTVIGSWELGIVLGALEVATAG
ncbi:MAG: hypothetical protein FJX74_01505 [Armatimonadetes bacterium]|nr:hypothetical protein [Armatimonadota bacterium]